MLSMYRVQRQECMIRYITLSIFKGLVHQKIVILSLITHTQVVPHQWDLCSSMEHKLRYF